MTEAAVCQTLCRHFADLLGYPGTTTRPTAAACAALLRQECPEAFTPFCGFVNFLDDHSGARMEEIYTATFDLQPACHPYVGYQLCGESQKRTIFLMQLQALYRRHNFAAGSELPDHLATLLRFIAEVAEPQCREELIRDGILPALDNMLTQAESTDNPYIQLLHVVRMTLAQGVVVAPMAPAEPWREEVCS